MGKMILKILGVMVFIVVIAYLFYSPRLKFDVLENPNKHAKHNVERKNVTPSNQDAENKPPKSGIGTWIGKDLDKLTDKFGQADRVYAYKNGFKNYVFKKHHQYYIVTVKNDIIKSVYATGKDVNVQPVKIMENGSHIFENLSINPEPSIKVNHKRYDIELSDDDMKTQALVKFGKNYAQIYIDQRSNKIMAVRFLDSEALVNFKPYQTVAASNEEELKNKHDALPYEQNANQLMTLYETTNEMRNLKGLEPLKIDNQIGHIASFNLYEAVRGGHAEFTKDALTEQLNDQNIAFTSTSQNVGSDFNDVPTLINSWLNSDIHRSRILNAKYTDMGGDVNNGYYTLIFVEK
ncbi:CAP-associated domain-containing protein [Staphylococcus pettenkoferi]|uniref:CAP-associated domain-containing protein n=1 Tax=Staphylococcus pettenkoferi TaxID=170573 RepID=UPI00119F5844|nr:CAP-associated domain-containing protein [Staphylococcus pettenkoferi]